MPGEGDPSCPGLHGGSPKYAHATYALRTQPVSPERPARCSHGHPRARLLSGVRSRWATQPRRPNLSLLPDASAGPLAPWRRLPDASRASRTVGPAWANSAAAALSPRLGPASCLCWCGARARVRRARAFHTAASVEVERAWRTPHAIAAIAKPQLKPQSRCRAPRGCCPSSGTAPSPWP